MPWIERPPTDEERERLLADTGLYAVAVAKYVPWPRPMRRKKPSRAKRKAQKAKNT